MKTNLVPDTPISGSATIMVSECQHNNFSIIDSKDITFGPDGRMTIADGKRSGSIRLGSGDYVSSNYPYTYGTNKFASLEPFNLTTEFPHIQRTVHQNPDGTFRLSPTDEELRGRKKIL